MNALPSSGIEGCCCTDVTVRGGGIMRGHETADAGTGADSYRTSRRQVPSSADVRTDPPAHLARPHPSATAATKPGDLRSRRRGSDRGDRCLATVAVVGIDELERSAIHRPERQPTFWLPHGQQPD